MTGEGREGEGGDRDGIGGGEKRERADNGIEVTGERGEREGGRVHETPQCHLLPQTYPGSHLTPFSSVSTT